MRKLGKNIQALRVKLGMTQESLAEKAGTAAYQISRIESGDVTKPRNLREIAAALGVDTKYLMENDDNTFESSYTGHELKTRREQLGWSLAYLADKANVSTSVIVKAESEQRPKTKFIGKIINALDMQNAVGNIGQYDFKTLTLALGECTEESIVATRFILNYLNIEDFDLNSPQTKNLFIQYLQHAFYSKFTGDNKSFDPAKLGEQKSLKTCK